MGAQTYVLVKDARDISSFMDKLKRMPDSRDNRGKRHTLAFVLAAVALAVMVGRSSVSGIQRYIENRIKWLRKRTGYAEAKVVSRAQLPRILANAELDELNEAIFEHFGACIEQNDAGEWFIVKEEVEIKMNTSIDEEGTEEDEWVAIDGKTLRGTDKQEERTLLAVTHTKRQILAQRAMHGPKESEIPAARALLAETGLEKRNVTLDALHLNPTTTEQIHQAGGHYIIQAKENQPKLKAQLQQVAAQAKPLGTKNTTTKGHGRIEKRQGMFYDVSDLVFAERWANSGFQTLIVMERERFEVVQQKRTFETSYYLSNVEVAEGEDDSQKGLFDAIRGHWGVEAENYIRDVTFGEDDVKTKNGNQGQVLGALRTLAVGLFRQEGVDNFQAALDMFADKPKQFKKFLKRVRFL